MLSLTSSFFIITNSEIDGGDNPMDTPGVTETDTNSYKAGHMLRKAGMSSRNLTDTNMNTSTQLQGDVPAD